MKKLFWIFVGVLIVLLFNFFIFLKYVHADPYKDLLKEYKQLYAEQLRVKIQHISKGSFVEVSLKDGKVVRGAFESYIKYDDTVFILPVGKHGIFADEAYDVRSLKNIRVVEPV